MTERRESRSEALAEVAARAFAEQFGGAPRWAVAAPGRVNLIGEHTDYNSGFVLPMAIERYTVVAAGPDPAGSALRLRLHSTVLRATAEIDLGARQTRGQPRWANYARGVVAGFQRRGIAIPALSAVVHSDVPLGSGLSSSAALEVAIATILEVVTGSTMAPLEKARLCREAEHEFAEVPCGLMDQLVCVFGRDRGPLLIDCLSNELRTVSLDRADVSVLIANTKVRHSLGDGEYARRRTECELAARQLGVDSLRQATMPLLDAARDSLGETIHRRARHVVTENARTLEAVKAFERGDLEAVGGLFYESHRSLRDDFEVSCRELDILVDAARELGREFGVYGSRMTGGGFGGCTVSLVDTNRVDALSRALGARYEEQTGIRLDAFVSRPAAGAHRVHRASPD